MKTAPKTYAEAWLKNEKSKRKHNLFMGILSWFVIIVSILALIYSMQS